MFGVVCCVCVVFVAAGRANDLGRALLAVNSLEWWEVALLSPTASVEKRVEALRHVDVDSPWRHAVLRHDSRLSQFFPEECAALQPTTAGADNSVVVDAPGANDSGEMVFA